MILSIVTTMYQSESYMREFYDRMCSAAERITPDFEILFVNDGSPDKSIEIATELFEKDYRVRVIDLSRNFGHHKAIMTGLAHAKGDYIFLIDSDLEEKPELLSDFWSEMKSAGGADVIYGQQVKRKGNLFEKVSGDLFYKIFNSFSMIKIPVNIVTARLMTRAYVNALISFKEQELFLAGIWALAGFNQRAVDVDKVSHSPTTYSITDKLAIMVNSITSFTNKPLIYIFYLGSLVSIAALFFVLYLLYRKIFLGLVLEGWTSILASIWLVGGIIIFSIGIIGVYLSKIFTEVKNRPYTIVKKFYSRD